MLKEVSRTFLLALVEGGKMRLPANFVYIFIVLSMSSCSDRDVAHCLEKPLQSKELSKIATEIELTFPVGSKVVNYAEPDVFVDPVWVGKVIIPTASYDGFQQAILKKEDDSTMYDGALANSTSWWKPINIVLQRQYIVNSNSFVKIVVSREGEEFVVYIECAMF